MTGINMATGDLDIALVLKLVDRVSAPARKVVDTVRRIGAVTEQAGRAGVAWADEQIAANQARGAALQGEAFGVLAVGAALGASLKPAIDFERSMAGVAAVARANDTDLTRLTATARKLGATTPWAASEAADGMRFLSMAGFEVNETIAAMPGMLNLASAGAIGLGQAADIASNILSGFNMKADRMGELGDVLTNTFTTSNTDLMMLGETMKYVAPVAAATGVALEQAAAMTGKLGDAGIQGSQAGTALRAMLNRLAAPTSQAEAAFARLNVRVADGNGNLRDMPTILAEMDHAMSGMGTAARTELVSTIFGLEAASAATVLLAAAGSGSLQDYAESLRESGGAARVARELTDNASGALKRLSSIGESVAISFGSVLLPEIVALIDAIVPGIAAFQRWAEAHPGLIQGAFKLAAGLLALKAGTLLARFAFVMLAGPVLRIVRIGAWLLAILPRLGAVLAWVGKGPVRWLLRGMGLLGRAFVRLGALALANPIGLVIASVAALAWVVYDNWEAIVSWFTGKVEAVRAAFDEGLLNGVFKLLAEFNPFTLAYEGAEGLFKYVTGWEFGDVFAGITGSAPFQAAYRSADRFVTKITGWDLSRIWATIKVTNPVSVAMQGARAFYNYIVDWDFSQVVADIKARFGEIDLFEAGVSAIRSLWDGMTSLVVRMVEDIKARLTGMLPEWARTRLLGGDGAEPGRDRGGPVRAGVPYLVGERQAEIFVPGVAGAILPSRVLKAAMAATAMAGPAAAMPSGAGIADKIDRRPAMTANAPAPRITREGDIFHITIAPPPGTDEETIVRLMRREIERRQDARRGDLHDGVDY